MDEKLKENIEKIKTLINWTNDLDATLYQVQAQYVVAMCIFNYIETLGMFLVGYYKKDEKTDEILIDKKTGKKIKTSGRKRFEKFFKELGPEYAKLIEDVKIDIYEEFRCGFTHELIPKKYKFSVVHVGRENDWYNKTEIEKERIKKQKMLDLNCSIIFDIFNTVCLIFVDILLYDFNRAKNKFINDIENGDKNLMKNFNEVSEAINLKNFILPDEK